jgi:hypothetical protein
MKKLALKISLGFGLLGYLIAISLYFAAATWRLSLPVMLAICPPSFLVMISMTDPDFGAIALLIAPLNAVLYGLTGLLFGLVAEGLKKPEA